MTLFSTNRGSNDTILISNYVYSWEMKKNFILLATLSLIFLAGCSSVPIASNTESSQAKEFLPPSEGKSGVYIYRKKTFYGAAVKRVLWADEECIGRTSNGIFFYHELEGNKENTITSEGEFSPFNLVVSMESGKLYYIEQKMMLGLLAAGTKLELINGQEAKPILLELSMGTKGNCESGLF